MINISVSGLDQIIKRMQAFPEKLDGNMQATMDATLLAVNEHVPAYPPAPPTSRYRRTGTLGRTLGSSITGGAKGEPEIYTVQKMGETWEGRFGTNLSYAPYVIDENKQTRIHQRRWWTLPQVAERAKAKIERLWQIMANDLAKYLEGM